MFKGVRRRIGDMKTLAALFRGAEDHGRRDGQAEPGAEHFLLAALDLPDGSARRAFARLGADPAGLEGAIALQYADALAAIGIDSDPLDGAAEMPEMARAAPLYVAAPSGREVIQALAESRKAGPQPPLAGGHVVAQIAALPHGVAARALKAMGIDRERLRRAALEEAATPDHS